MRMQSMLMRSLVHLKLFRSGPAQPCRVLGAQVEAGGGGVGESWALPLAYLSIVPQQPRVVL